MDTNKNTTLSTQSVLPSGWRWVKLGEVCELNPPKPKGFYRLPDAPTTFVPMSVVDEKTGNVAKPEIVPYKRVSKGYTYFEEDDVLFAKITPCMQNGKHVIARNLIDGIGFGTTEFHVLQPTSGILPEWIWYFIRQPYFLKEAIYYFTGSVGQQRVPDDFLADYTIPLPPTEEQKRVIAEIQELMQEIERAKASCEKQLDAANALSASYLRQVFESDEAKKWERKRLGDVCEAESGIWGDEPDGSSECYSVLRSNNIQDGKMVFDEIAIRKVETKYLENKSLKTGDILVTTSSGSKDLLGKSAFFTQPSDRKTYLFSNFTIRLRTKNEIINSSFLYFYLQSPEAKETLKLLQDTTTGLRNLDRKEFLNQTLPVPTLEIQRKVVGELKEKIGQAENLQSILRNQQSTIDALPQSILKKAFRGEL
ncbi:MAG: restriction endonuclease subunit S [Candidatus Omnitrophota bacterium]|nr:restriction endonuclease subunit S [Candidatus Omnitrophota bacterium]